MRYNVELHVGCMTLSVHSAENLEEANAIKNRLETDWNDPVITEGPGLEVIVKEVES